MEIKTLTGENIFCFGEIGLEFDKFGNLTLIEGDNKDSAVADSNGAGKTSIYELLLWVYTAQTKKGMAGNDVINEHAPKGAKCFGESVFYQGGVFYRVTRTRNGSPYMKLEKHNGVPGPAWGGFDDITKGTDRETQALLESIIKMSFLTFSKMTYFGQEDIKSFGSLGDKDLKAVFEQALGIDFIRADYEKVWQQVRELKSQAAGVERESATKKTAFAQLEEKVKYLSDADAELKAQQAAQVDAYEAEINSLIAEANVLEKRLSGADAGAAPPVQTVEDELARMNKLLGSVREKLKAENGGYFKSRAHGESLESNVKTFRDQMRRISDIVGTACRECGKTYQATDLEARKQSIKEQWIHAGVALKTAQQALKGHAAQIDKLEDLKAKLNARADDLRDKIATGRAEYEKERAAATQAKAELKKLRASAAAKKSTLDGIREQELGYEKDIKEAQEKAAETAKEITALESRAVALEGEVHVAGLLKNVLGDGGLKNYVFNAITPELNRLANEYLQTLENIHVEISTVKQLKSGEFRDKFSIELRNPSGSGSYKANSGGERQKIDFAVSLAFNAVVRAMSEESVNLLFLDEPFESLDESSAENAAGLLDKIAGGSKTFLIAHNQHIKQLTYEAVTVEKSGGFSTVRRV